MLLRRITDARNPCKDFLDIEDIYGDSAPKLRGRLCGDLKDFRLNSRSSSVALTLRIAELTADMPQKLGFEIWYQTKGMSMPLLELYR